MRNHPADPAAGGAFGGDAGHRADIRADAENQAAAARRRPIVVGLVGSGEAVRRHAETIIASPVAVIGGLCDIGECRSALRRTAPRRDEPAFKRPGVPPQSPGRQTSAHRFAASSACVPSGPRACDRPSPSRPPSAVPLPPATAWERMLADTDIELVVLCTPAHTHQQLAAEALFARKAVLLDQPAVRSERQLDQLLALAARCGRPIGAMFPERFRLPDVALLSPWSGRTQASIEVARAAGQLGRRAVRYADVACQMMGNPATVIALGDEQRQVRPAGPAGPAVAVWFESGAMLTVSGVPEAPAAGSPSAAIPSTHAPDVPVTVLTSCERPAELDTVSDARADAGAAGDAGTAAGTANASAERLSVCDAGRELVLSDGAVRFRDHDGVQWYSAESPAVLRAAVYVDFHRALRSGGDLDRTALARSRGVIRLLERLDEGTAA